MESLLSFTYFFLPTERKKSFSALNTLWGIFSSTQWLYVHQSIKRLFSSLLLLILLKLFIVNIAKTYSKGFRDHNKESDYKLSIKYILELTMPGHPVALYLAMKKCRTSGSLYFWDPQFHGEENWSIVLDTNKLFSKPVAHELKLHLSKNRRIVII